MTVHGQELPYCLARHQVIDDLGSDDDSFVVQWLVPGLSKEAVGGVGGRRKQVVDIFGPWETFDSLQINRAGNFRLPKILVRREQTLMINVELDSDNRIPFTVLDELS